MARNDSLITGRSAAEGLAALIGKRQGSTATFAGKGRMLITVPGAPVGKPRMTQRDKWKKRPAVVRYHEWCDIARSVAGRVPPADTTIAVNWTAYFEPPQSWSKKKRAAAIGKPHRSKPDRDNIDKAVLDCLWADDSGVSAGTIRKYWADEARLEIEILWNE